MFFPIYEYFKHLISSFHLHGVHSPFVYAFNRDVIQSRDRYYIFDEIESLRSLLLLSDKKIQHNDLGVGSRSSKKGKKSIKKIVKSSSKPQKYAELLFRIAKYNKAKNILELGTNLGISTAYLATATTDSKVISIEGCPNLSKVAQMNFKKLNINNIDVKQGNFDDILPSVLAENQEFDLIFIDGNHTQEATNRYFEQCLKHISNESIMIFDDIYWSPDMKKAWKKIIANPKVTVSLDLFYMGIVFFREGQKKEDFTIHH